MTTLQTVIAEPRRHNHLLNNHIQTYQISCKTDHGCSKNIQPYRKMNHRRVIDTFGSNQIKCSTGLLPSVVSLTGVKVSFLSDGYPLKCGFDVVERQKEESSFSTINVQSRHSGAHRIVQKIPVVEFLETSGKSHTNNISKTVGNCDDIICNSHNGVCKLVTCKNNSRKKERSKNEVCHHHFLGCRDTSMLRGLPWEFFSQMARQCRPVQQRIGCRNLSGRFQHHHRCRPIPKLEVAQPHNSVPEVLAKTGGNRKTSGINCFVRTEILSGVGIFNGQSKELVLGKNGKGASTPYSSNGIRKHRMTSSVGDSTGSFQSPSLQIGTADSNNVQGQNHGKITPWTLRELLHLPETNNVRNGSKQIKHWGEEGRSLKTETGKYKPYSKTNIKDYVITNGFSRFQVKSQMSVGPYLNYVGSASNQRTTGQVNYGSTDFDFKRRLTLNSPVTDEDADDVILLSSWCSSADSKYSKNDTVK